MTRALLCTAALLVTACDSGTWRQYDNNDLELATGYGAKELCSCLFVMEMPLDYCTAWTKASPAVVKFNVDTAGKRVESTALLEWGNRAHYENGRFGCVIDD